MKKAQEKGKMYTKFWARNLNELIIIKWILDKNGM
jgi:hypothetical protein